MDPFLIPSRIFFLHPRPLSLLPFPLPVRLDERLLVPSFPIILARGFWFHAYPRPEPQLCLVYGPPLSSPYVTLRAHPLGYICMYMYVRMYQ